MFIRNSVVAKSPYAKSLLNIEPALGGLVDSLLPEHKKLIGEFCRESSESSAFRCRTKSEKNLWRGQEGDCRASSLSSYLWKRWRLRDRWRDLTDLKRRGEPPEPWWLPSLEETPVSQYYFVLRNLKYGLIWRKDFKKEKYST